MTIHQTKEDFDKINVFYQARYYAAFGRDDSSYKDGTLFSAGYVEFSSIQDYKFTYMMNSYLRHLRIKYLDEVKKYLNGEELSTYNLKKGYYKDSIQFLKTIDYLSIVAEDKKEEFKIKYQLYRAFEKIGEFCDIEDLPPIFSAEHMSNVYDGFLASFNAGTIGVLRDNILQLKEMMAGYVKFRNRLDQILETRCAFARVKYYNDWTKSEYGKDFLNKNEKVLGSEFLNDEAKEKFEQCFDLYQKISNLGIADRLNYVNHNFEYTTAAILLARQQAAQRAATQVVV